MHRRARDGLGNMAATSAILLVVLSGCLAQHDVASATARLPLGWVAPAALEAGHFYAFHHDGGAIAVTVAGGVAGTLFGSDDARLGAFGGTNATTTRFASPAGEVVVHVQTVATERTQSSTGVVQVRSGDADIDRFQPLGATFQRDILAETYAFGPVADPFGKLVGRPIDVAVSVNMSRAPSELRLLATGAYEQLDLTLRSPSGIALQARDSNASWLSFSGGHFASVPSTVRPANFAAHLEGSLHIRGLDGAIVLESWSFSRAAAPMVAGAEATPLDGRAPFSPSYLYDALPDRPALFQVGTNVHHLAFVVKSTPARPVTEDGLPAGSSWIALYGPRDEKLLGLAVAAGETVIVPVTDPGHYVAYAEGATVYVEADGNSTDASFTLLDPVAWDSPAYAPGSSAAYGATTEVFEGPGIPFAVHLVRRDSSYGPFGSPVPMFSGCPEPGSLRVTDGNETLGFWGTGMGEDASLASMRVRGSPVVVQSDGFGDGGCGHVAVEVLSYVRR